MLTTPEVEAIEYAKTLDDVLVSEGINWNWVYRFTSKENAELYDKKWLFIFHLIYSIKTFKVIYMNVK